MSAITDRLRRAAQRLRPAPEAGAGPSKTRSMGTGDPDMTSTASMFGWCLEHEPAASARPQYLWGVLQAASEGRNLGLPGVSVLEFGVAGGNGIVALEQAASAAERLVGVHVSVFGFDTGTGMPPPKDHRDVPWAIRPGYFVMDEAALRARLARTELVLGPVSETVATWSAQDHPPAGFAAFDLDYYSSTVDALQLLDAPAHRVLPRVVCYFDDIFGYGWTDFTGERAAIADYNASHPERKVGPIYGLKYELPESEWRRPWPEQIYLAHLFDHPRYRDFVFELPPAWFEAHRLQDGAD